MLAGRFALTLLVAFWLLAAPARARNILETIAANVPRQVGSLDLVALATAELEKALHRRLDECVAHSERLLDAVGLELPPPEDSRVRDGLRKLFGHARLEKVSLTGPTQEGFLAGLCLQFRGVDLAGLKVDLLQVDLRGLRLDVAELVQNGRLKILKEAQIELTLRFRQEDITRSSPYYRITFTKGDLGIAGERDLGLCDARFELHGNLVGVASNQLIFRPRSLSLGGITIPRMLYKSAVEKMNPLADFTRSLGGARRALDVQCDAAVAIETGHVDIHLRGTLRPGQHVTAPPQRQASAAAGAWAWQ